MRFLLQGHDVTVFMQRSEREGPADKAQEYAVAFVGFLFLTQTAVHGDSG